MPITRRNAVLLLGCARVTPLQAQAEKSQTTIHQEVDFKADPHIIYQVLLDSKQFSAFTGHAATIQAQAGGAITMFGGLIEGRNIELVPDRRIVQAWREASWKPGYYSLVSFELMPQPPGTHLVFNQTGIAEADFGHLNEGWPIRYWKPLANYLKVNPLPPALDRN